MVGGQAHTFLHLPFRLCQLFFCWRAPVTMLLGTLRMKT